ncbi:MAG: fluoride efflux transporter CrcB [Anaerolineaceae bacterium]|nr:fluoride efflux transporter CrcB [Anaerolineaceae bacterium]MDE0329271.1 fluoride efflux transporter CrcB [Anaerolineaceae bacterium]
MQPSTLVSIGAGGLLGACARHLFGLWIVSRLGVSNPVSTMIINITGSFLLALFLGWSLRQGLLAPQVRLFVSVGFCGAFTTFSTFAYESIALAREGQWLAMTGNILGNNLLCLAGVGLGLALASRL